MIFKRSLRHVLLAAFFWCCCSLSFAQTQNTYFLGLTNDHYSTIENPAAPGQFLHAGTVANSVTAGTHDIHVFELDGAGNILWENIYATPFDERAFHIDVSAQGFIISGYTDEVGLPSLLLMEIAPGGAIIQQQAYPDPQFINMSFGLHVQMTLNDPIPGYVVAGICAMAPSDTAPKEALLMKVGLGLGQMWLNTYDSPSANNDYDMGSHVIETADGYFMSGSCNQSTGNQQVLGVKVDFAGNWQWDTEYLDTPNSGHYGVGAGAIYDGATNQIHQLCNLSIIHHWGVTTYDNAAGARNLAQSFRVFSNLGFANVMGCRIMQSPDPNNLIIAGLMRDHAWAELDENGNQTGNTLFGSPPWMCEVDKNGTTFLWDQLYQVPSPNYNANTDFFSSFSAGQQARILHPEMAIRKLDGLGYWLNAYNSNGSGIYDLEVIETDLGGNNNCSSEPLGFTFATNGFFDEDQIDPTTKPLFQMTPGINADPHTATFAPCFPGNDPCVVDPNFIITDLGDCCYEFRDLTPEPGLSCQNWIILDSNGNTIVNGVGTTFIHCFAADGIYQICYEDCCIDALGNMITAQSCQLLTVECECIPDADFSITELGDCCYQFDDLTPDPNSPCNDWTILDGLGNIIAGGTGTSFIHCFQTSGTYQICYTDCCVNPDGTITTTQACQLLDVECDCIPDADFSITDIGDCCYQFDDLTPDPNSPCNDWTILDGFGNIIGGGTGSSFTYCFQTSGTYQICFTDCCVNPDGTITTTQACQLLDVECDCIPNAEFIIDDIGDCCYQFSALFPDPNSPCNDWTVLDAQGNIIGGGAGTSYIHCFTTSGTYQICFTTCCVNPDGTVTTAQTCQLLEVDCGCEVPAGIDFDWVYSTFPCDEGCAIGFNCPTPLLDPDIYCVTWDFGDGTVIPGSVDVCPIHCYTDCGLYTVCMTVYCCEDPTQSVTVCHEVDVDCCCEVEPFDFQWGPSANPLCPDGCSIGFNCPVLDPDLYCVSWDFGDGTPPYTVANSCPIHCYEECGIYTVCLTVYCCEDPTQSITVCHEVEVDCCCDVDPLFVIDPIGDCCYAFFDPTPSQFNTPVNNCDVYTITDVFGNLIATGFGDYWEYCFDTNGTYVICHTDCCENPDGTITEETHCETIEVYCCEVEPFDFTWGASTNPLCPDGCSIGFDCPILDPDLFCVSWDFGDGTPPYTVPNSCPIHCYEECGIYTVCLTVYCCEDPTQSLTVCHEVVVDCCCDVDPVFVYDPIGDCCYAFVDPTPSQFADPVNNCDVWTITDVFGNLIATGFGDYWEYCFDTSGTYVVCHTDCCENPDGTIHEETYCETIVVDCCDELDIIPSLDIQVDGCVYTFTIVDLGGNNPDDLCVVGEPFGGAVVPLAGATWTVDFTGQCTGWGYCFGIFCCEDDAANAQIICVDGIVDCCCDADFALTQVDECCVTVSANNTNGICLDPGGLPTVDLNGDGVIDLNDLNLYLANNCCTFDMGDGSVYSGPGPITHCYDQSGVYDICYTTCCLLPDGTLVTDTQCQTVTVECCDIDPVFVVDPMGDCCYAFFDPTPSLNSPLLNNCNVYQIFDVNGVLIASSAGDFWEYCFEQSGTYTVCHTDCCVDVFGNIIEETHCIELDVNCPCPLPTDLSIVAVSGDGCQWGFCVEGDYDLSQHCVTWDFGDGTVMDFPLDFCPLHQYLCDGTYTVCATVYCCDDPSISTTVCVDIVVDCPCQLPSAQLEVDIDECTVTGNLIFGLPGLCPDELCYIWDFGDGSGPIAGGSSQSHTYAGSGTYNVCVTIYCCDDPTDPGYTLCQEVTVNCDPCTLPSDAGIDCVVNGCTVAVGAFYTDDYDGNLCFVWDFGDGTPPVFGEVAAHQYFTSGTYVICLTIFCCDDPLVYMQVCKTVTVECDDPCPEPCELNPRFVWMSDPFTYETGCCVHFTDVSVPGTYTTITSWHWDFGDGTTSNLQNPTHCFADDNMLHTICLTITGTSPEGDCEATFCWEVQCGCEDTCPADLDGDGDVDTVDLLFFLANYNSTCP